MALVVHLPEFVTTLTIWHTLPKPISRGFSS
jgi:hypothetical protein